MEHPNSDGEQLDKANAPPENEVAAVDGKYTFEGVFELLSTLHTSLKDSPGIPDDFRDRAEQTVRQLVAMMDTLVDRFVELSRKIGETEDMLAIEHESIQLLDAVTTELREMQGELEEKNRTLAHQADHDGLTGLWNRRYVSDALRGEIERGRRYKRPLSVVMLDLDRFKKVNDTFGHQAGDAVLRALAETIGKTVRDSDIAGRFGGEEFLTLLPETDMDGAVHFAERLLLAVQELEIPHESQVLRVTASLGVTEWSAHREEITMDEIVRRADVALYWAKDSGRDQYAVWTESLDKD